MIASATSATGPVTHSRIRGRGPITALPTELLLGILEHIIDQCTIPLERQQRSQLFLPVNRAFRSAYLLSEAAHECALTSTRAATVLSSLLAKDGGDLRQVRSLWIEFKKVKWTQDSQPDLALAKVVDSCGGQLRRFVWEMCDNCGWHIRQELVDSLAGCTEMEQFRLGNDWRNAPAEQFQQLLAAWPNLTSLDVTQTFIDFKDRDDHPSPIRPTAEWTVPTRLHSLEMHVYSKGTCDLLARRVAASTSTLGHIALSYNWDHGHDEVELALPAAFQPVAETLTSFGCVVPGNGSAQFESIPNSIEVLTKLDTISVELETVPLDVLTEILRGRKALGRLTLLERPEAGFSRAVPWDDLVAFLGVVKVDHLAVSPGLWAELWKWLYPDWEAEEEPDPDEMEPEKDRLAGLLDGLVRAFEWV